MNNKERNNAKHNVYIQLFKFFDATVFSLFSFNELCAFSLVIIWTNALKLSTNYSTANCGACGRSERNHHCRHHVCSENGIIETLPRVRGTCPRTELIRNIVNNKIRLTIANLFRMKKLEVYEEIYCQTMANPETQNRRADIIARHK